MLLWALGLCVWSFAPGTNLPLGPKPVEGCWVATTAAREGTSKGQHVGEAAPCFVLRACGFCGTHASTQGREGQRLWQAGSSGAGSLGVAMESSGELGCERKMWQGLGEEEGREATVGAAGRVCSLCYTAVPMLGGRPWHYWMHSIRLMEGGGPPSFGICFIHSFMHACIHSYILPTAS